jgi:hypothetical protein
MWRLVEIGEVIENGDSIWADGDWQSFCMNAGQRKWVTNPVRRWAGEKKPAEPAVSVGDRVEVVSGTWAKSCGTVTGFETQVSISQTSMRVLKDSVPVVRLDNVFVGGKPLTIRVSSSEVAALKSAPKSSVQVDPEWRMLEIGEVIREGDECSSRRGWEKCSIGLHDLTMNEHDVRGKFYVCRRVRLQLPGWRYLDAGETVQFGDEYASCRWRWDIQQKSTGRVVSSSESFHFRRKTTPLAG